MKTKEEIKRLYDAIIKDFNYVPVYGSIGEPDDKNTQQMYDFILDLEGVMAGRDSVIPEIESWLSGKDSYFIEDFIVNVESACQ